MYAEFEHHRDRANSAAMGVIFCTYVSFDMLAPGTTLATRTSTNASMEQNDMCIIVNAIGNGNPYTLRIYLLNKMTPALKTIQMLTVAAVSAALRRIALAFAGGALTSVLIDVSARARSLARATSRHGVANRRKTRPTSLHSFARDNDGDARRDDAAMHDIDASFAPRSIVARCARRGARARERERRRCGPSQSGVDSLVCDNGWG
jgi:hypothetical protein